MALNGIIKRVFLFTVLLSGLLLSTVSAVELRVIATHNAKFNLDGRVLGFYRDHSPLRLKNVAYGPHKLYAKSLITGELKVFKFNAVPRKKLDEFQAIFAPPRDSKNMKARRRTALAAALTASEIIADDGDEKRKGRKIVGGLAVVNELIPGKRHDRQYGRKYGNTIEVKSQVPVEINLDGRGKKYYKKSDAKRFHNLAPSWHKIYIRNVPTGELRVFKVEFPQSGTRTVTIRPDFAPPKGEKVNSKARRRTALLAGLLANEVLSGDDDDKKDRRKVLLGAGLVNEAIPTNSGRRRKEITLNLRSLGAVPMSIEHYDRMYKK